MDTMEKQRYIFGSLFLLANKLQVLGDRHLEEDDITTRQWFLNAVLAQFKDRPPTLGEVAELLGSSHQNVKQLALKLQSKGFVSIEKDREDGRVLRLRVTDKSEAFWKNREGKDYGFLVELFKDCSEEEMNILAGSFSKLLERIQSMEQK